MQGIQPLVVVVVVGTQINYKKLSQNHTKESHKISIAILQTMAVSSNKTYNE